MKFLLSAVFSIEIYMFAFKIKKYLRLSLVANWKQTFGAHLVLCKLQMLGNKQIKAYDK